MYIPGNRSNFIKFIEPNVSLRVLRKITFYLLGLYSYLDRFWSCT